jgi:tartrate-resistant acid phosphatase type 5
MSNQTSRRQFLRQTIAFSALTATGSLTRGFAQPVNPHAQHILMIGDWGAEDMTRGQQQVAASMVSYAAKNHLKPQSLFMLGDTWYGDLDGGVASSRWNTQFEQLYPASAFPGPAYTIPGNHDYQHMPPTVNKLRAELDYAKTGKSRWTMPSRWYTFDVPTPDHKPLLHVIATDTNAPHAIKPSDTVNFTLSEEDWHEQTQWLVAELARPTPAPFTIVLGHHPIFSNGPHGDHARLIADWEPIIRQHKVTAYLAGHDHDLQHLEFAGHPTSFVCSGAGGADLYDIKIDEKQRGPYAEKVHGFTHLEATPEALTFRHVNEKNEVVYAFTKSRTGEVKAL